MNCIETGRTLGGAEVGGWLGAEYPLKSPLTGRSLGGGCLGREGRVAGILGVANFGGRLEGATKRAG